MILEVIMINSGLINSGQSPIISVFHDLEDWKSSGWRLHWKEELHRNDNPGEIESFRLHIRTEHPLGTDSNISKLETMTGRRLRAEPVGRPKKKIKTKMRKFIR